MYQLLELSIFSFFIGFLPFAKAQVINKKPAVAPSLNMQFLEQAEEIEREAWWVVTNKRVDPAGSPFRILRAAMEMQAPSKTTKNRQNKKIPISKKFCQTLVTTKQTAQKWRIEAACQKPTKELGTMELLSTSQASKERWKISWKTESFPEHFGLSASTLYGLQSCELELDAKKRLTQMNCPMYVRDRATSEIVEFKVFEYNNQGSKILKLEGEIKKDLQPIATFKTEVPLVGDIVLKIKNIPQKVVEEEVENKQDFSNIEGSVPTRGDPHGQKENPQTRQKSNKKSQNQKYSEEENRQNEDENYNEAGQRLTEEEREKKLKGKSDEEGRNPTINQNEIPANQESGEEPTTESVPAITPSR